MTLLLCMAPLTTLAVYYPHYPSYPKHHHPYHPPPPPTPPPAENSTQQEQQKTVSLIISSGGGNNNGGGGGSSSGGDDYEDQDPYGQSQNQEQNQNQQQQQQPGVYIIVAPPTQNQQVYKISNRHNFSHPNHIFYTKIIPQISGREQRRWWTFSLPSPNRKQQRWQ